MITSSISAVSDDSSTVASVTIAGTREGIEGFVELLDRAGLRVLKRVDVHDGPRRPTSPPAPAEAASDPHSPGTEPQREPDPLAMGWPTGDASQVIHPPRTTGW